MDFSGAHRVQLLYFFIPLVFITILNGIITIVFSTLQMKSLRLRD